MPENVDFCVPVFIIFVRIGQEFAKEKIEIKVNIFLLIFLLILLLGRYSSHGVAYASRKTATPHHAALIPTNA